uniref:Uncharacterized protein n=1 Tax=Arundo donax TaxID=35708 RepID=A0A0A9BZ67_ARUDO
MVGTVFVKSKVELPASWMPYYAGN